MSRAQIATYKHIARVRELLGGFAIEMIRRGDVHDSSKFFPVEMEPLERLQAIIDTEGPAVFGTDEYRRRTDMLGSMITHHRANNSHHPEYYENGVSGMDLHDLVEMFFDWKAASERGDDVCMRLSVACDKYGIFGPLRDVLYNTARRLGYVADDDTVGQGASV